MSCSFPAVRSGVQIVDGMGCTAMLFYLEQYMRDYVPHLSISKLPDLSILTGLRSLNLLSDTAQH